VSARAGHRTRRIAVGAVASLLAALPSAAGAAGVTGPLPALPPTPVSGTLISALTEATTVVTHDCATSAIATTPGLSAVCETAADDAGTDAYLYGIAPMEFWRQAAQQTSVTVPNSLSDAPVNQFGSARQLANAAHQVFVQPNNDTLYTMGHLNLSHGPIVMHVPAVPDKRYYVMQFLDPYTNVFAYVGTRTTGDGAGNYLIAGPGWHGAVPSGLHLIQSPYELAWIAGRTLVYGATDLPEVHRIQNGYRLIPLAGFRARGLRWRPRKPRRIVTTHTTVAVPTGVAFFDRLGAVLAASPPPAQDATILGELRADGIGPGLQPSKEHLSAPVLAGLAEAADDGYSYVYNARTTYAAQSAIEHHGWFVPSGDTGDFGSDYQYRAIIALFGLAANEPTEAMYIVGVIDQTDRELDGADDYVIHFAAGQLPPARYFWSVTMYDSGFYLVPNAINRYSLGNRSAGLAYNTDGSLDIYVQHAPPTGHESNWLPAPASGKFEVTLRMYGPQPNALDGAYQYPPIMRAL
jgi:hypothetical protein